jgi:hypothetical protein
MECEELEVEEKADERSKEGELFPIEEEEETTMVSNVVFSHRRRSRRWFKLVLLRTPMVQ